MCEALQLPSNHLSMMKAVQLQSPNSQGLTIIFRARHLFFFWESHQMQVIFTCIAPPAPPNLHASSILRILVFQTRKRFDTTQWQWISLTNRRLAEMFCFCNALRSQKPCLHISRMRSSLPIPPFPPRLVRQGVKSISRVLNASVC